MAKIYKIYHFFFISRICGKWEEEEFKTLEEAEAKAQEIINSNPLIAAEIFSFDGEYTKPVKMFESRARMG